MSQKDQQQTQLKSYDQSVAYLGILCALLIVFTPYVIEVKRATSFFTGPLFFPILCLACICLASIPSLLRVIKYRAFDFIGFLKLFLLQKNSLFLFVMLVLFIPAIFIVGVELTTFILLFISLIFFGHKKYALIISLITVAIIWFVFVYLLDIYFPDPYFSVRGLFNV